MKERSLLDDFVEDHPSIEEMSGMEEMEHQPLVMLGGMDATGDAKMIRVDAHGRLVHSNDIYMIDVDSTLYPFMFHFIEEAKNLYGVDMEYEKQTGWDLSMQGLSRSQAAYVLDEVHSNQLKYIPYPYAVRSINRWYDQGKIILIASYRDVQYEEVTRRWLERCGFRYHVMVVGESKEQQFKNPNVKLVVDDSPGLQEKVWVSPANICVASIEQPWISNFCHVIEKDWDKLYDQIEMDLSMREDYDSGR
jgi:hypothetical protein